MRHILQKFSDASDLCYVIQMVNCSHCSFFTISRQVMFLPTLVRLGTGSHKKTNWPECSCFRSYSSLSSYDFYEKDSNTVFR